MNIHLQEQAILTFTNQRCVLRFRLNIEPNVNFKLPHLVERLSVIQNRDRRVISVVGETSLRKDTNFELTKC